MRVACALRIIRGKNIYNFAILENLRIFQNCLFTGGVVKANGSCSACFLRKRGAAISILSLSVTFGDSSPKGRALGIAAKFPVKL